MHVAARRTASVHGVIVVDKPRGPTSHDVVSRVRKALDTREVGHAGTLDPMATGVLVVLVGQGTKLAPYLTNEDKAYHATVKLGVATTTLDAEGEVTETCAVPSLGAPSIERALEVERSRTSQIPPDVSAIKIDGVAAHAKVRRGEVLALPPRPVAVRALVVTNVRKNEGEIDLEVVCSKGYYVRALARDLASSLGTVGHLVALRRVRSGAFRVEEGVSIDPLDADRVRAAIVPVADAAARALPVVRLTPTGVIKARQGKILDNDDAHNPIPDAPSAWLDDRGGLVAVGERREGSPRVLRGFSEMR
jgi:tRNA pseudouridine55 synthase